MRQTWCARDASWGCIEAEVDVELSASSDVFNKGRLHISQWFGSSLEVGGMRSGSDDAAVGGAECVLGGMDSSLNFDVDVDVEVICIGVDGDVLDFFCFLSTIDRYVSATFVFVPPFASEVEVVVFSSPERTKGTRFLLMPAPKTRWSSSGRK